MNELAILQPFNFSELATARADGLSLSRSNENEGRCLRVHRAFCALGLTDSDSPKHSP
jgi:hypothetical protein